MKNECSAGGLIVQKTGSSWKLLLIKDMSGSWTFPKGLVESSETKPEAATREIQEEVGVRGLKLLIPLKPIEYFYRRNGLIHKSVDYFLFGFKGQVKLKPQRSEGITEAKWFTLAEASSIVGYSETNKSLIALAQKYLRHYGN